MKILDTSDCTSTNIMFLKSGHYDFLQQAHKETVGAALRNIVGSTYDPAIAYVLWGMTTGPTTPGHTGFSAGAIFFNGEVYLHDAQSISDPTGSDVFVANVFTTPYTTNADPTDFSDGTPRNVCDIRTVSISTGASASGDIADFSDFVYLPIVSEFLSASITYGSGCANLGGSYYDIGYKIEGNIVTLCGAIAATAITSSLNALTLPPVATPAKKIQLNIPFADGTITVVAAYIDASGHLHINSSSGGTGNIYLDGISYRLS